MEMQYYDLIIIGGGPSGLNIAIEAGKKRLNYLVLEKGVLVNSIFNFPTNMTFFSTSKNLEIGDIPFISHNDKPTRKEALEYYRRLTESYDVNIHYNEKVTDVEAHEGDYLIRSEKSNYICKYVVISTGYYDTPRLMNVPGEDLPKVKHYYDEVHPYIKQKVLVVGGANSACDVALETWQKGAMVTMAVRQPQLYQKVKYWILPNIENRIKEGSIKAFFNTTVQEIRENEIDLLTPKGKITIENDVVLAMTGYQPNFHFLENIGIALSHDEERRPIINEQNLESNLPNIYLSGVINGGMKTSAFFIENTRDQGERIVNDIVLKMA